jgi:GrpB-like predicted nucleotidyltransferase (UPF0157 family)
MDALDHLILQIEHVGSTAVPDLLAKPILDIDIVIQDYSAFPQVVGVLQSLGYEHQGDQGIPEREAFKAQSAKVPIIASERTWVSHHLYVCPTSAPELRRHVCFRDALRAQATLRREYEALKISIAHRAGGDRSLYAEIKERECREFVERVLESAEQGVAAEHQDRAVECERRLSLRCAKTSYKLRFPKGRAL